MKEISPLFAVEADELLKSGKLKQAVRLCLDGIEVFPDYQTAHFVLADAYKQLGQHRKSLDVVDNAIAQFPNPSKFVVLKSQIEIPKKAKRKPGYITIFLIATALTFLQLAIALTAMPVVFPRFAADTAETLRNVAGAQFVAQLEEISLKAYDFINRIKTNFGYGQDINFYMAGINSNTNQQNDTQKLQLNFKKNNNENPALKAMYQKFISAGDSSNIGWSNFYSVNNDIIMYNKKVCPDPDRPYSQIFLIKINLEKVRLNFKSEGVIPQNEQNERLLAAFNGGFRYVNGKYGMMADNEIIYEPRKKIATLYIYKNNKIELAKWNDEKLNDTNIVAFRQNCPLILEDGNIPELMSRKQNIWGFTIDNKILTWRSGVGLTKDGKYLIYAFGKSISVEKLAEAFLDAGAFNAMQLDINAGWTKFVMFNKEDEMTAQKILDNISAGKYEYLRKSGNHSIGRDFFYLTYK